MRKLLLAGAAVIGSVGLANAQTTTITTTAAPMPMAPTQGMPSTYNTIMAGNNSNNSDGSVPSGAMAPTPGTVVIHLNGRINFYAAVSGSSLNVYQPPTPGVPESKLAPFQFLGYFRLYPGMDAMATNGLRYGGIAEIRQNFIGQSYGSTGTGLGGPGSGFGASPSGSSCGSTLYVRREAIYLGSNQLGIVRLGQDDGPFSQFDGGVTTFQNFNDGAWNGDLPGAGAGGAQPTFPFWSGVGNEYTIAKAVYFSPNFSGFDAAVSFAPNNSTTNDGACGVAGAGCSSVSSASTGAFGGEGRATNMMEVMGRYRGSFGGVGIYGIAGYSASGHVSAPPTVVQYNGYSVGDVGLTVSYAGFSVGGNALFGDFNGQVGLQPKGGASAVAWIAGAQYATGPITAGLSYFNYQSQGSAALVGVTQRYDDGFAAGLTYSIAPGLVGYVSYLYGQAYQGDYNFATGAVGAAHNNVHYNAFSLGTRVFW